MVGGLNHSGPGIGALIEAFDTSYLKLDCSNDPLTDDLDIAGDIFVANRVGHMGDIDTYLSFLTDDITFVAGGVRFLTFNEGSSDSITFNVNSTDIDFIVNSDISAALTIVGSSSEIQFIGRLQGNHTVAQASGGGQVGYTLEVNTTEVGNVGAGEDDLISKTLVKSQISDIGDYIWFEASGTTGANANQKQIKAYFGVQEIYDTGTLAPNNEDWSMRGYIVQSSSGRFKASVSFIAASTTWRATTVFTPSFEQATNAAIEIKLTGRATSNDDIVQEYLIVGFGGHTL